MFSGCMTKAGFAGDDAPRAVFREYTPAIKGNRNGKVITDLTAGSNGRGPPKTPWVR